LSESAGPKLAHDAEIRDPAGETKRQANPELNGIIAQQKMEFVQMPIRKREFVAKREVKLTSNAPKRITGTEG
jgi:hypothetical protein